MAKTEQRWLVFVGGFDGFRVYYGTKPQRTKRGKWPKNRRYNIHTRSDVCQLFDARRGGPVELKT